MNIGIDIETRGLDATKFICGAIVRNEGKIKEFFVDKNVMWKRIIELGIKESRRKSVLNVYGHNMQFDMAGICDFDDPNMIYFCNRPFIWAYKYNGKQIIKFLDTYSIFDMNLDKLGKLIGLEKLEMPEELKDEDVEIHPFELKAYNERDAEICLKAVDFMKKKLEKDGINLRRLYTINQIAINYTMKKLQEYENRHIFSNKDKRIMFSTIHNKVIHSSIRGGRVECWKLGEIENVNYIDCNSLYGYASMNMRFPDLRTERIIFDPMNNFEINDIFEKIGISRCMIYNKSNEIGLLPIRTNMGNYFPKVGQYLIGTWTHRELKKAVEEGYEIIHINFSLIWEEGENPFKFITRDIYNKRLESGSEFDKWFYKKVMNASYGKFAQHTKNVEYVMDSVEMANEYLKNMYTIIKGYDLNYMYKKEFGIYKKNYYCPILFSLITAEGRVYMYENYKKIGYENLIYTDTDSIIFDNHINMPIIDEGIGKFKFVEKNKDIIVYGRKSYIINDNIHVAGADRKISTVDMIKQGKAFTRKMKTIKTADKKENIGKFDIKERNLKEQTYEYNEIWDKLKNEKILIDNDISNISPFVVYIKGVIQGFK